MTQKENREVAKELLNIFSGILFNNQEFGEDNNKEITYNLDCPEYKTLIEKYNLEEIAGKGSDFEKAKNLLHYLAPRLTHSSWYDNHISCNALDLLEYSLNNPEQGINCRNKSKILEECCLALGIYSRRVKILPYSPFDFDSHVVTEIYDREIGKWIMLDPTTDGLFVDEKGTPLSLLEMRKKFANDEFVTYVCSTDKLANLDKLRNKYIVQTSYICKNLFFFEIDQDSTFGETNNTLSFVPSNYSVKAKKIANLKYKLKNLPQEYKHLIPTFEKDLVELNNHEEIEKTNVNSMLKAPIK